ncbi:MAG: cytochrome C oxidase subunit IV family protein [Bacteroidetes bacterium]|nr:cytochrome C oxidase subunit IV family protein [Bacteroidota bacterium]
MSKTITSGHHEAPTSYGIYVLIWLALMSLTAITAVVAGIDLAAFTLVIALLIAVVKSSLVVNVFMRVKYDDKIFKIFIAIAGGTLTVIFLLTFADVYFRR